MIVQYYSNNSGGGEWLFAEDWKKLEAAGWKLFGFGDFEYTAKGEWVYDLDGLPRRKPAPPVDPSYALKRFDSLEDGIDEWEMVVGQDAEEEGCDCCGRPHAFSGVDK